MFIGCGDDATNKEKDKAREEGIKQKAICEVQPTKEYEDKITEYVENIRRENCNEITVEATV
jgi:hypothetical protein